MAYKNKKQMLAITMFHAEFTSSFTCNKRFAYC